MARYLLKRLIMLIGIVFVITVGAFYLIHLLPGDPAAVILGTGDSPENRIKLYKQLGLNKPIVEQYFVWIKNVLHGATSGTSFISGNASVWSTIKAALPIDVEIIVLSQILAFAFAIPTAMRSARKPDGALDRILSAGSFTLLSYPIIRAHRGLGARRRDQARRAPYGRLVVRLARHGLDRQS